MQNSEPETAQRRSWWIDMAIIWIVAAILIWPMFKTKYYENWGTIDSTFIADARYLGENLPHPGWDHIWYGGTRWDYIYPPALRYGAALLGKAIGSVPARGYHLYTAIFYSLGIVFVYVFARTGGASRYYGYFAAFCAATLSPTYLFLAHIRADTQPFMPQRLNALVRYGEGPHMTAFALLPLGLAFAWRGLRRGNTHWLAASAFVIALVVSNNFYGAASLALLFPVVAWAVFCETGDFRVWLRAVAIACLSWGLCSIWLTPSFFLITPRNLALVSRPGHAWSFWVLMAMFAAFAAYTWRFGRRGGNSWTIFVTGAAMLYVVNVLGNYYIDFRVMGEPERFIPEADLCMILFLGWLGYLVHERWPTKQVKVALAIALIASCAPAYLYFAKPWRPFVRTSEYKHLKEFEIADWIDKNRPDTRSYVTGTLRFWWNAWHNGQQIGGGAEQGVHNFALNFFYWRIVYSDEPTLDIAWFQSLGIDNVMMNDKTSSLPLVDHVHPYKFKDKLKVLWEDGKGNWIYEVPRRHPGLVRVVDAAKHAALRAPVNGDDAEAVRSYADVIEKSSTRDASSKWTHSDTMEITAETAPGEALVVQVSHDDYWRAREGTASYPITRDAIGQMRIEVPPGKHKITMHFDTPLENTVGRYGTALSLCLTAFLIVRRRRDLRQ